MFLPFSNFEFIFLLSGDFLSVSSSTKYRKEVEIYTDPVYNVEDLCLAIYIRRHFLKMKNNLGSLTIE